MRLAAHITFYYVEDRLPYLKTVVEDLLQLNVEVDVYIYTNRIVSLFTDCANVKYLIFDYQRSWRSVFSLGSLPGRLGLKRWVHPYYLAWENRRIVRDTIDLYDVQLYLEDDISFTKENFDYWLNQKDDVMELGYNLGFVRIESNSEGAVYITDIFRKPHHLIEHNGKKFMLNDVNSYCGFWIYQKEELKRFVKSREWNFKVRGYPIREKSAIGWHGLNMKRYKGTLIPLDVLGELYVTPNGCAVRHLPNNYIGHGHFCEVPFPISYPLVSESYMKVCGFSFVRNGTKYDYPYIEAIRSIMPICDKIIVAVGKSDDDSLERVKALGSKIQIIETVWDESLKEGGRVLAAETDKAFQAIPDEYDWAFYIQGDEVVHEKYLPEIQAGMLKYVNEKRVEGLLLNYKHFFGSYDFIGTKYSWYRREIRIVRNRKDIFSYRDAQGFRKAPNEKLNVKLLNAYMYHYGYVRNPRALKQKVDTMLQLYKEKGVQVIPEIQEYDYEQLGEPLTRFNETHPAVMTDRIKQQNWNFKPDLSIRYASAKDFIKRTIGKLTGWFPGEYRNYRIG